VLGIIFNVLGAGSIDTYGDAVSEREDAEAFAVEGCLAGLELGW